MISGLSGVLGVVCVLSQRGSVRLGCSGFGAAAADHAAASGHHRRETPLYAKIIVRKALTARSG